MSVVDVSLLLLLDASRFCSQGMEQQWGVAPNVYHFTSLVTCLLKAGQWSEAIAMTDKMEVRVYQAFNEKNDRPTFVSLDT